MSSQISEGNDAALQKRIRQAVYDIRYKARKEELDLRHAYSQYIGKSGLDQTGKEAVQNKLFGKSQQQESKVFESADSNKYKVRVTDDESGKTYIRYAKRSKINKLRSKGTVEMTGHGSPKGAKKSPSVKKKDRKAKLTSAGPAPKKPTKAKVKAGIKIKENPPVLVEPNKKMETKKTDAVGSAVQALRKVVRKEAFIADAAAVAPPTNKKITGEKVDNSKLIKVFPQDGSDPQIGSIKSSYKPVGEVVSEILATEDMQKGYEVTNADKKANTPAWQGYIAGKKKKDGTPLYKKAAHMEEEIVGVKPPSEDENIKAQWPFKNTKAEDEGDDGTGRSMYAKWNNAKNRLRSMGLKMNYDLEGDQLIEDAVEYFYEQGITEETIDLIVEEVGLDDFVEFVLDPHQDLVEARSARKAKANAPSYEKVKASVDASDAAKKKAGKGEYSKSYAKRSGETEDSTNYNDKPAAKKKAKAVASPAKKAATKKKVTTAVKKVAKKDFDGDGKKESPKAEYKGSKDKAIKKAIAKKEGLRGKITSFVKKGVERHKKARAAGKVPEKRVKEFASGVKSGVKTAVKFAKDVKKVVSEEEERLRASGKFTEEQIEAILESEAIDEARRADKMGIPRKKVTYDKGEETRNPNPDRGAAPSFKPEGGSLAGSKAASRARSLGDARRKANRKGANLAYGKREGRLATFAANKRDSDSDLGSQKAATDTGAHKDKQGFRQVHKYGERGDKRRPSYNPKHTANTQEGYQRDPEQQEKERKTSKQTDPSKAGFTGIGNSIEDIMKQNAAMKKAAAKKTQKEHHQVDANGKVIEHGDGTPSSVEEGFVCESTLVRDILSKKN